MTNFGEHYNEELAQQESEINKRTLWEMVGAFIVLTAVWGLAFGRFPTVNAIVCNFHRFFYCVCDLIF